ncbi:hypothetical protein EYV94_20275 [Puteibacter caeruleilacunae]|nr:hypothetical protein EYV94_20275 [Puteibacter caeruleilacunae]
MRKEQDTKTLTQRYYRMEFIGAGMYNQLASQCEKQNTKLAQRLRKVASDEYRHGLMFGKFYENHHQGSYSKGIWLFLGRMIANMMICIPFKQKIKKFSIAEAEAVAKLDRVFDSGEFENNPFLKCLKAIYKDELDHSKVYEEYYSN